MGWLGAFYHSDSVFERVIELINLDAWGVEGEKTSVGSRWDRMGRWEWKTRRWKGSRIRTCAMREQHEMLLPFTKLPTRPLPLEAPPPISLSFYRRKATGLNGFRAELVETFIFNSSISKLSHSSTNSFLTITTTTKKTVTPASNYSTYRPSPSPQPTPPPLSPCPLPPPSPPNPPPPTPPKNPPKNK